MRSMHAVPTQCTHSAYAVQQLGLCTLFMCRFRTVHIDFWANENPSYADQQIQVPVVVRHILTIGKGHHLPKDTVHLEGGTMVPTAFYGEVSRLRTRRQEDLEKQAWKS